MNFTKNKEKRTYLIEKSVVLAYSLKHAFNLYDRKIYSIEGQPGIEPLPSSLQSEVLLPEANPTPNQN